MSENFHRQTPPPDPVRDAQLQFAVAVDRLLAAADKARREKERLVELIEAHEATRGGAR
jgi:hypothetical protein